MDVDSMLLSLVSFSCPLPKADIDVVARRLCLLPPLLIV